MGIAWWARLFRLNQNGPITSLVKAIRVDWFGLKARSDPKHWWDKL